MMTYIHKIWGQAIGPHIKHSMKTARCIDINGTAFMPAQVFEYLIFSFALRLASHVGLSPDLP